MKAQVLCGVQLDYQMMPIIEVKPTLFSLLIPQPDPTLGFYSSHEASLGNYCLHDWVLCFM
jgi:hypothetical protein